MHIRYPISVLMMALTLTGCTLEKEVPSPAVGERRVLVFAASSTMDAVGELAIAYREVSKTPVHTSFASSSTLAQQVENGAEADVFLSAHPEWVEHLEEKGLVAQRRDLLENRLVLIAPRDAENPVQTLEDLSTSRVARIAIGDPDPVPVGKYAKQALTALGLWNALKDKIVPAHTARQALVYVERGEVDAGIVYATDARASKDVRIVAELDPSLSEPVVYPLVLLNGKSTEAKAFFDFMHGPEAAGVFQRHGFMLHAGAKEQS